MINIIMAASPIFCFTYFFFVSSIVSPVILDFSRIFFNISEVGKIQFTERKFGSSREGRNVNPDLALTYIVKEK